MMKKIVFFLALILLIAPLVWGGTSCLVGSGAGAGGEYCSGISWNTLSDFTLDFDHTTDNRKACYGSSDGELGVDNNSPSYVTPATVSPVSGGKALLADGNNEYLDFDNSNTYFQSQYGSLMVTFMVADNNAENLFAPLEIIQTANEEQLRLWVNSTGEMYMTWESGNDGADTTELFDFDDGPYYGCWVQLHIIWDTTRCTDTGEGCGDAEEEEIAGRYRIDANADGDFDDGGVENWQNYVESDDATDHTVWDTEPTTNDIHIGLNSVHECNVYVDDVEFSTAKPSWP